MGNTVFFSKLTFNMNKTFKTWGKALQLQYAYKAIFLPNMAYVLIRDHIGFTFWVVTYRRFKYN